MKANSKAYYERKRQEAAQQHAAREPWAANIGTAVETAHTDTYLEFPTGSGCHYRVPYVPFIPGETIHGLDAYLRWLRRTKDALAEQGKRPENDPEAYILAEQIVLTMAALAAEYKPLVRPRNLKSWWAIRGKRNPFVFATEAEIEELARFFREARTVSRVTIRAGATQLPPYRRMTSKISGMPLLLNTPPTSRRTAFRAVGSTLLVGRKRYNVSGLENS